MWPVATILDNMDLEIWGTLDSLQNPRVGAQCREDRHHSAVNSVTFTYLFFCLL